RACNSPVGFLRHLANVFARSHCWAIFLFGCRNQNTWGRAAHGRRDNSIDCDSDLRGRFCAGPIGQEATPFRRRTVEDETVIATSPTRPSSALASWSRRIPVRRGKPRPARPCQPNWRAGALVPRFPLKSGCGHDAGFARAARGCVARRPWLWLRWLGATCFSSLLLASPSQ